MIIQVKVKAERNTFGLPTGEAIRKALVKSFRRQRREVLAQLAPRAKAGLVDLPIEFAPFREGALAMAERMAPLLEIDWDSGGRKLFGRIGIDPDQWQVTNPHTEKMIKRAALDFCTATNATTSLKLNRALKRLRAELVAGVVKQGEAIPALTTRVKSIFDSAETSRARRIAQTEASRAVHAAQEEAAKQSGMVAGWEWLLSADACPLCQVVGRKAKFIRLGEPFAIVGDDPTYSQVRFPPLHPHCNCTVIEVLKSQYSGEPEPDWAKTLDQPKPEAVDYPGGTLPSKAPRFGPSMAKVQVPSKVEGLAILKVARAILGRRVTIQDLASLVGAPDLATVAVRRNTKGTQLTFAMAVPDVLIASRRLKTNRNGKAEIQNQSFSILPPFQKQGLGTAVFGRQVEQAARLGVARITAIAAREDGPNPQNGYYTWPLLGYDADLPREVRSILPADLSGAARISDLFGTEAGIAWWKEHGLSLDMEFDMAEGSRSRKRLDAYIARQRALGKIKFTSQGKTEAGEASGYEDSDLSDDDIRLLIEINLDLAKKPAP